MEKPVKLSELSPDTMLYLDREENTEEYAMTKEQFMESMQKAKFRDDVREVYIAVPIVPDIELSEVLNQIVELYGLYANWDYLVYKDLMEAPETAPFLERFRSIITKHAEYDYGAPVEIDIDF